MILEIELEACYPHIYLYLVSRCLWDVSMKLYVLFFQIVLSLLLLFIIDSLYEFSFHLFILVWAVLRSKLLCIKCLSIGIYHCFILEWLPEVYVLMPWPPVCITMEKGWNLQMGGSSRRELDRSRVHSEFKPRLGYMRPWFKINKHPTPVKELKFLKG